MHCFPYSDAASRSCSLVAGALLLMVATAGTGYGAVAGRADLATAQVEDAPSPAASSSPTSAGEQIAVHHPRPRAKHHRETSISPEDEAPQLPVPIPRMTLDDLPSEAPVVTYSMGILTLDSDNTTLAESLTAIREKTGLQFEPLPESKERFAAHFSGSARDVIAQLLSGSEFGYVIVASSEDPATLEKLVLTKRTPMPSAEQNRAAAGTFTRPASTRPALAIPTEIAAERRGESLLDVNAKPLSPEESAHTEATQDAPAALPPLVGIHGDTGSSVIDPATPSTTTAGSSQSGSQEEKNPVSAAGQYMQELYRMRLQQQASPQAPATSPQ